MQKITLSKWAVVTSVDNGRMIHIGNGEFVAADAHLPKVIETCRPKGEEAPGDITAVDAPEYEVSFELGSIQIVPVVREEPEEVAP